jgi:hypothetical protein
MRFLTVLSWYVYGPITVALSLIRQRPQIAAETRKTCSSTLTHSWPRRAATRRGRCTGFPLGRITFDAL